MLINVYKPKGLTSFDVVAKIRKQLGLKRVGHAGTLDPLAEGVLIVLTDGDTKKQSEFMVLEKEYIAEVGFGISTDTFDLEFLPKFTKTVEIKGLKRDLKKAAGEFVGTTLQEVPMYSAISVNGQRLYKLARKGQTIENLPRKEIVIKSIDILDLYEDEVKTDSGSRKISCAKIKVACSSGTYIRALVRDLGVKLGTDAVMLSLVRTRIGDYKVSDSLKIGELR